MQRRTANDRAFRPAETVDTADSACARTDAGTSLIEIIVSVLLTGVSAVALLVAMRATVVGTSTQERQSEVHLATLTATQMFMSNELAWMDCALSSEPELIDGYHAALPSHLRTTIDVTGVDFWNGTSFGSTCSSSSGFFLQRVGIDLTVQAPDGPRVVTFNVLKRPAPTVVLPTPPESESTFAVNSVPTTSP